MTLETLNHPLTVTHQHLVSVQMKGTEATHCLPNTYSSLPFHCQVIFQLVYRKQDTWLYNDMPGLPMKLQHESTLRFGWRNMS